MTALYPVINQARYPGVGDVDDCAVIATFWAARASGFTDALPTVFTFRAAAGVPDAPGSTGMTNADVWAGVRGTVLGSLGATTPLDWTAFAAALLGGDIASVQVDSSKLPIALRFGFLGIHRVGAARDAAGRWYLANPLAPEGSAPQPIGEIALRGAMGAVRAVLFPPQEEPMSAATITILVKPASPRTFRTIAGSVLNGYDPLRPGVVVKSATWSLASPALFSAVVSIVQAPNAAAMPNGTCLRVVNGAYAGLYVRAADVTADIGPEPDAHIATIAALQTDLAAAVRKIAAVRAAVGVV